MRTTPCRSCGAAIGFIDLPSGKKMPVDPELVKTFRASTEPGAMVPMIPAALVLVTERGALIRGIEVSPTYRDAEPVEGYVSHFATCTDPQAHRRPRTLGEGPDH